MKTKLLTLLAAFFAVIAHAADSPFVIPFQGRLTNQQGTAYNSGQYSITFNLYSVAVGGSTVWTERHEKVGVVNGMVNVFLGSINALGAVDFSTTKYLGITVDVDNNPATADPEMVPRQMIIPAFWAKQADNSTKLAGNDWSSIIVDGSNNASNNPFTGFLKGSKLSAGSISSAQLSAGSVTSAQLAPNLTLGGTTTFGGQLIMPASTGATAGVLNQNGSSLIHTYGSNNFFAGTAAGNFSMTGTVNTGVGGSALSANTSGLINSALGFFALGSNTTGIDNSAIGGYALTANTTGSDNTASGAGAMQANFNGNNNTAAGFQALTSNTSGGSNTAIGWKALQANTTGNTNIALGAQAGDLLTTGSNNIVIGNAGVAGESNAIRIGTSQSATYVAGIATATIPGGQNVVVNAQGRLGKAAARAAVAVSSANVGDIVYASSSGPATGARGQPQQDVFNQSVTITTGGGPVFVNLCPAGDNSYIAAKILNGELPAIFSIWRGAGRLCSVHLGDNWPSGGSTGVRIPPGAISFLDKPPAGSHTYRLTVEVPGGTTGSWEAINVSLTAIEF